jgi:hypothetical protein
MRSAVGAARDVITIYAAAACAILGREGFFDLSGASVIISYDGTPNDDDALALGKVLARAGLPLAPAYVRHSREFDPRRKR